MAALNLQPPESFNFQTPDEWPQWRKHFEQYKIASGIGSQSEAQQINTLLYCLGEESDDVLTSTGITDDERKSYKDVLDKFDSFFKVRKNVIFERARFNRRQQGEGETAEQYIAVLHNLASNCDYSQMQDQMIRDRLVVGIRVTDLSERLQLDCDLTLEKATKAIREKEAVYEQQSVLNHGPTPSPVDAVRAGAKNRKQSPHQMKQSNDQRHGQQQQGRKHCTRCRKSPHSKDKCPTRESVCHRCHCKGHYSSQCRSQTISSLSVETELDDDTAYLDVVETSQHNTWTVKFGIGSANYEAIFKIDTGAKVTAISEKLYKSLKSSALQKPSKVLKGPGQYPLHVVGQFEEVLKHGQKSSVQQIFVIKDLKSNLLGLPAITALNLAARLDSTYTSLVEDSFPTVFKGLGNLGEPYAIKLKDNAVPYALFTPRTIPLPLLDKVEELSKMESKGLISKVNQPTPWCAGMVAVQKKSGAIRICVDLKRLNHSVMREVHPLPKVDNTLAKLSGAKIFSKLDANSGFWQIPLSHKSRLLTTFITPFGCFCFNKLPFGIASAPEHFKKQISNILKGLKGVVCQMDDVLVFGSTKEEHDARLKEVLQQIPKAGVTLNQEKCLFGQERITFLGHVIDKTGISPDPDKVSAILQMKPPTTVSELHRFMGMVNQLGKFSPRLATISQPLRALLSKQAVWTWNETHEASFQAVKDELTKSPVLALYDPKAATKVSADASSYGLGAILLQKHQEGWRPVAFASRSMSEVEQQYSQIEKEALACTWASERFADYLIGMSFSVETDHKPLIPLLSTKHLNSLPPRVLRFRLRMDRFDFSISHVPGKLLCTADTLSRSPVAKAGPNSVAFEKEIESFIEAVIATFPATKKCLQVYLDAQQNDPFVQL